MLHIEKVILVEGKYDRIKLESVTDASVLPLDGFGVFSGGEKTEAIRKIAARKGVIVLTDSDAAGFKIRGYINGILPASQVFHAYIPDVYGKEKRKLNPSKEGKLGVEGIDRQTLENILKPFCQESITPKMALTKADLYADGLVGVCGSEQRRRAFAAAAGLPARIGANALLDFINTMLTPQEYREAVEKSAADSRK